MVQEDDLHHKMDLSLQWHKQAFVNVPRGFWLQLENQKRFVHWLELQLNITNKEDWYCIPLSRIIQHQGGTFMNHFTGSILGMLKHIYPDFQFLPWKFNQAPRNFWSNMENQKKYFHWLEQQLNITKEEDWYKVTTDQIRQHYGAGLLSYYQNSPIKMLQHMYPNFHFLPWKFTQTAKHFWDDPSNLKQYLDHIAASLGMGVEDLKTVPTHVFKGTSLLQKYTLQQALTLAYPEKMWNFNQQFSKGQAHLQKKVEELFGSSTTIFSNYKHPTMKHRKSNKAIELDLFIPDYQLAIEYQGWQHDFHMFLGNLKRQKERDHEKREQCQLNNILLISIPELWSGLVDDLAITIHSAWAGLSKHHNNANNLYSLPFPCPTKGNVILPSNSDIQRAQRSKRNFLKQHKWGKLFLLPKQYHANINPVDWWLSEKYDGFRGMWIGTEKHFKTKGNTTIIPPAFVVNQLPTHMNLDGELWYVNVMSPVINTYTYKYTGVFFDGVGVYLWLTS